MAIVIIPRDGRLSAILDAGLAGQYAGAAATPGGPAWPGQPRFAAGVFVIVLAAAGQAALVGLHKDLALDEPFMANAVAHPADLWPTLVHDNVPLAYALLLVWTRLFGSSAFALRALSMAAFGGAAAFTGVAARRAGSIRTGWLAALLVACSAPIGLALAATARPYALLALFAAMTLWAAVRADRGPDTASGAALLVLAHLLGLFTHPVFLFASAASALAGALCGRRRRLLAGAPIGAIVVYLAAWGAVLRQTLALPATSWMTRPGIEPLLAGGTSLWGSRNGFVLAGIVLALVAVRGAAVTRLLTRHTAFAGLTAILTIGGTILASQFKPVYFAGRTPILILPAAAMTVAAVIVELGTPTLAGLAAVIVLSASIRYTLQAWRAPDPAPTRASLAEVTARASCGDTILAAGLSYAALTYYAVPAGLRPCVSIQPFPREVRDHPGWLDLSPGFEARLQAAALSDAAALPETGTIWIFTARHGIGMEHGEAIVHQVGQRRRQRETLPLRGTFFDEVAAYGPVR